MAGLAKKTVGLEWGWETTVARERGEHDCPSVSEKWEWEIKLKELY